MFKSMSTFFIATTFLVWHVANLLRYDITVELSRGRSKLVGIKCIFAVFGSL